MRRLLPKCSAIFTLIFLTNALHGATITVALQSNSAAASSAAANSAALQSAIARAISGDTVRLPAGNFPLESSIRIKSNVNVVGSGAAQTILTASFKQLQSMIIGRGVAGVGMHDFTLDGVGNKNVTQGIELEKSDTLIIHDVTIQNLPGSDLTNAPLGPHAIDCTSAVHRSTFDSITCKAIGVGRTWGAEFDYRGILLETSLRIARSPTRAAAASSATTAPRTMLLPPIP